ncbi:neprilysin-2-like [Microplitis mediator]|uniref:neprilysin-2-like n=1 Tax=Microplitis mediator TaxID=375433 RepID=UPI0025575305|nr:neprilysin-2-like [Microplitis mediator]
MFYCFGLNLRSQTSPIVVLISDNVCDSPSCIHTASEILKNMDSSVDPCDDFYKFACGGFIKSTIIPDHDMRYDSFSAGENLISNQLRRSLEDLNSTDMPYAFRLAKTLYSSCMNKTYIEEQGYAPLMDILKKLGGWPVLEGDTWNDHESDWTTIVSNLRKLGYSLNTLLGFSINLDRANSSRRVIYLDDPVLGLTRLYLVRGFKGHIIEEYYRYMVDIAVILGADRRRAEKELMDSLEFEMKLAKISLPGIFQRNATLLHNPMTVAELSNAYPSISWKKYFNRVLEPFYQFDDNDTVIVSSPLFMSNFEQLMKVTSKRIQTNYLIWRAIASTVEYLNDEIRKRQLEFNEVLNGETDRGPRWKECVATVTRMLPISIGAMYVRNYFNKDARENARDMILDIRDQFMKTLKTVDWMDEETRKHALDKVASMTIYIAYPDELLNDTKLDGLYKNLKLDENASYLGNILTSFLFDREYTISELKKPVNKSDWVGFGHATMVDAYASLLGNSIHFPAGIFQGNLFDKDRPKYLNYGGIGFIVGHEITHGFDDQGSQYDKNGNLVDWWDPSTKEKYLRKAQCIIDQYDNYTIKEIGMNVVGFSTQGENIADNGGIKQAYLAYRNWADHHKQEPKLPGLHYTPRQMFWISAANGWCAKLRPEFASHIIASDSHVQGEFRIIGSLSNRPEFAKDFNCALGSNMNPIDKCSVW